MATFTVDLLTGDIYLFSGDFGGSGSTPTSGSTYPQVNDYSALPAAGSHTGQIYVARNGYGTYVLNRKPAGFYFSTGTDWRYLGEAPADLLRSDRFQILDSVDSSKGVMFITSGITTGTFPKLKIQNSGGTIAYLANLNTKVNLSAFIDYTGTTAPNTYLKLNQSTPQHVGGGTPIFDTINLYTGYTTTGTEPVGTMFWDGGNHTATLALENGVRLQMGQELHIYGKNISGGTIYNGQPVAVVRSNGQWTAFGVPVNITTPAAYAYVGLATQTIPHNGFGYVTINGVVRDINTNHLIEGKAVYVNPTGGTTSTYPTVPNYVINVGIVERKHATQGRINVISKIVPKLFDLSDVNGTPLTTTGQFPAWDNSSQYFDFNYNINDYLTKSAFTGYSATTLLLINAKQDVLTAGYGINIDSGNTISVAMPKTLQLLDTIGGVNVNNVAATAIQWTTGTTGTSLSFTGGSRIYIQGNGLYGISYVLNVNNDTGSAKNIGTVIRKNGNSDITPMSSASINLNNTNDSSTNMMPEYLANLSNGDYVELMAFRIGTAGAVYTIGNGSWIKIHKMI
jgi:hypothetical protein